MAIPLVTASDLPQHSWILQGNESEAEAAWAADGGGNSLQLQCLHQLCQTEKKMFGIRENRALTSVSFYSFCSVSSGASPLLEWRNVTSLVMVMKLIHYQFIFHQPVPNRVSGWGGACWVAAAAGWSGGLPMHSLKCTCLFGRPPCDGQPNMHILNLSNPAGLEKAQASSAPESAGRGLSLQSGSCSHAGYQHENSARTG